MKKTLAALALAPLLVAAPANATVKGSTYSENTPGCFSHKEWLNLERGTMKEVETYAGVIGAGKVVVWQDQGDHIVKAYPWCGHPANDSIQVSYNRNVRGQYMANYAIELDFGR